MALQEMQSASTTDFTNQVPDYIVDAKALDASSPNNDETYWYFDKATENYGYYLSIPEIYSAANNLATWAFSKGYETEDLLIKIQLDHVRGQGKDTFDKLIWNHEVVKLIIGDAFMEVKFLKDGKIANMIPISPERVRLVYGKNGLLKRYDTWNGAAWKSIKKENMFHSSNKRIGDQMHGTSQIDATKWIIDARNEALEDERTIKHRDKALGIVYYESSNTTKIAYANTQIEKAVKNGEMLGLPKDVAKIEAYPSRSSEDRQNWISYLENFFYQVFGVPRAMVTSDGTSEVGGKMGYVIFEPIYGKEQRDIEGDLKAQLQVDITFNRPPSLGGMTPDSPQEDLAAAPPTIQNNDAEVSLNRE